MNPRTRFKTSSGRRQWLGAAMTLVAGGLVRPVLGQPVSAAAEEAKAPPLPALGSTLAVPPVDLIGGGRFDPAQARGKPLLVYWWSSICPFCALQSPEMDAFWKAQQGRGLQMLALGACLLQPYSDKPGWNGFPRQRPRPEQPALSCACGTG